MTRIPRKVDGVLAFIDSFERVVECWPRDEKKSLYDISNLTQTKLPFVIDYLSTIFEKVEDVHENVSFKEADKAFHALKLRFRHELEAREKTIELNKVSAHEAYIEIGPRVGKLQMHKKWHTAYRTVSYFYGENANYLQRDVLITLCNDALRFGSKAGINFQELATWLRKGVELCLGSAEIDAVEEALDFVHTYGGHFLENDKELKGHNFIQSLLFQLGAVCVESQALGKLGEIIQDLEISLEQPQDRMGF